MSSVISDDIEVKAPFIRSPYNYDREFASDSSGLFCEDASLAKQSFLEESDINTIVRRFGLTGELPTNVRMPTFGDFSVVSDFHEAMNAIAQANEAFDSMPAEVRARFNNDPGAFVAFCSDEANRVEARKLGLVSAEEAARAAALVVPGAQLGDRTSVQVMPGQVPVKPASTGST